MERPQSIALVINYMTKNNSKNWLQIENEFIEKYPYMPMLVDDEGHYVNPRDILRFFKPYFQELEEKAWMYDQLNK